MTRAEIGREYFLDGCNCSQSVVMAFSDLLDIDEKTLMRLSLPFGSGTGRMRLMCGALNGAFTVLGLLYGDCDGRKTYNKDEMYGLVQKIRDRFKERHGTIMCGALLSGVNVSTAPVSDVRDATYYKKRPCPNFVYDTVEILEEFIDSHGIKNKKAAYSGR